MTDPIEEISTVATETTETTDPIEGVAAVPSDELVSQLGNKFVEVAPGRFAQTNPQPVILTNEFQSGVDEMTKNVLSEINKVGSSGNRYR
jgi:hypothetical protein